MTVGLNPAHLVEGLSKGVVGVGGFRKEEEFLSDRGVRAGDAKGEADRLSKL